MLSCIRTGLFRAARSPLILLMFWLLGLLLALPATIAVHQSLTDSLDGRLTQRTMREGFDVEWYYVFQESADGVAETFTPTLIGGGAFFQNIEDAFSGRLFEIDATITGLGLLFILATAFLNAGTIERYSHATRAATRGKFAATGGTYLFRFIRLALTSAVFYVLIFLLFGWVNERIDERTRDVTTEGTVLWMAIAAWIAIGLLLALVHLTFDYAKIAMILERRKSALLAMLRGLTFVVRHPLRTFGLFFTFIAVQFVLILLYHAISPGIGEDTFGSVALLFAFAQLFLILRLFLRLGRLSSEVALYAQMRPPRE